GHGRRRHDPESVAEYGRRPREDAALGGDLGGAEAAGVPVRGAGHRLRLDAGRGAGERPRRRLLPAQPGGPPVRIVSLLPSATEIVCALGLEESLVGVSHECDYPPFVKSLPKVTRTLIPHDASSREIDALV